jgi:hypothetical protein
MKDNQTVEQAAEFPAPEGENDWVVGSPSFSRKEVFNLLWTQRAMITNDLKRHFGDDLTNEMYEYLDSPRQPEF